MRPGRAVVVLVLAASAAATIAGQQPPLLRLDGSHLVLSRPPRILDQPRITEQLESGLTTSFVFQVTGRDPSGRKVEGGGVVEVRYELWDEAYLVSSLAIDGRRALATLDSREALGRWWEALELKVLPGTQAAVGASLRVELTVVPFSSAEQQATREWFRRSLDATRDGAASGIAEALPESAMPLGDVLALVVTTSIARESVASYFWNVTVAGPRR